MEYEIDTNENEERKNYLSEAVLVLVYVKRWFVQKIVNEANDIGMNKVRKSLLVSFVSIYHIDSFWEIEF